ncbi:hypothetical protein LY78DRAFT_374448 [Colletotrichum sublineola]|nr:hypothetical protein LY78DRAFT_374448 [Colletotrichum sublineola]
MTGFLIQEAMDPIGTPYTPTATHSVLLADLLCTFAAASPQELVSCDRWHLVSHQSVPYTISSILLVCTHALPPTPPHSLAQGRLPPTTKGNAHRLSSNLFANRAFCFFLSFFFFFLFFFFFFFPFLLPPTRTRAPMGRTPSSITVLLGGATLSLLTRGVGQGTIPSAHCTFGKGPYLRCDCPLWMPLSNTAIRGRRQGVRDKKRSGIGSSLIARQKHGAKEKGKEGFDNYYST